MVAGLDRFREAFAKYTDRFVLIGGVAAEHWFSAAGMSFRVTRDFDLVLIAEALDRSFVECFWRFVAAGGYRVERADGRGVLYRFSRPTGEGYPEMLELFSRRPELLEIPLDQAVSPVPTGPDAWSLSAILMDDEYHELVVANRETSRGISMVSVPCLILLEARAWVDLVRRRNLGERVDARHINKHRNDVFKLATLLTRGDELTVPEGVHRDLQGFLRAFPADSPDWTAIQQASGLRRQMPDPEVLLTALGECFRPGG